MSLDKVAFLRFKVIIAEEVSSLVTFLKEKTLFVSVMRCFIVIMLEWLSWLETSPLPELSPRIFIPRFETTLTK